MRKYGGSRFLVVRLLTRCPQQIEKVAEFCGLQLTRVPRVKDIEHEVDTKM